VRLLYRKGWKSLNHTESECFTKKPKKKEVKKTKKDDSSDEYESGSEGVTIKAIRIGKTSAPRTGYYEYDTAATHHTTNELGRLKSRWDKS